MTILVTGGAGFIGSNFILESLKNDDEKIINIDSLTYAGNLENLDSVYGSKNYEFIECDIADTKKVNSVLEKYKPNSVINFAAESHVDRSILGPEKFFQTNVIGTLKLLDAIKQFFINLDESDKKNFRFIHVSTDEVYGSLSTIEPAFTENNQFKPNSPYAASKASSDHIVRAYNHTYNIPCIITNCSNNYGPFQFPEKLIPLIIVNAIDLKPLPIYGKGDQIRDWLFVKDHCAAIKLVLKYGTVSNTYNIGGNCEMKNLDVVLTICNILDDMVPRKDGKKYDELIVYVKDRPGHDIRYAVDSSKIKKKLSWEPKVNFNDGLMETIKWYMSNNQWLANIKDGSYQDWITKNYSNRK